MDRPIFKYKGQILTETEFREWMNWFAKSYFYKPIIVNYKNPFTVEIIDVTTYY